MKGIVNIGDIVKITKEGSNYPSDYEDFHKFNFDNPNEPRYMSDLGYHGTLFKVIGMVDRSTRLAIENTKGEQFIIGKEGVEIETPVSIEQNVNQTTVDAPQNIETMKKVTQVIKTKTVKVSGVERDVTAAVLIVDGLLRGGYAVRLPDDSADAEIAATIAKGRALNNKTNVLEMQVGFGMDKKFILHAIADNIINRIEWGEIVIKGIK